MAVHEIRSWDAKLALILQKLDLIRDDTVILPSMSLSQQRVEVSTTIDKTANLHILSPIDALQLRQAYSKRHTARLTIRLNDVWTSLIIKSWSTAPFSKTLLIRGSWPSKNDIDTIGTELTTFAQSGSRPSLMVLWALQQKTSESTEKITWTEALRYLAGQALKHNATAVSASFSNHFHLLNVATASSTQDWENVLIKSLLGVPVTYMVIDLELIEDDLLEKENVDDITESINRLVAASPSALKFAIINQRRQRSFNLAESLSLDVDAFKRRGKASPRATRVSNRRAAAGRSRVSLAFRSNNNRRTGNP
ncbi:hypothetical protein M409DRAFT_18621 [Zasmidium cellare ATCC 36951]|uniref:Uncharacterized protein n=1 Tax=Zasmidium cellare ATCC 36951 TaxID=1080233 RepID=A0A6A6CZB6_ZASCE|nr:uncharacterized protein M409DRAFT_18621 [Zasmidium cellare ATCC 36951]KAF2171508.1 hypothetical protein M409DRAFT_18621 [Zasmidium cellare ATCC 36951]